MSAIALAENRTREIINTFGPNMCQEDIANLPAIIQSMEMRDINKISSFGSDVIGNMSNAGKQLLESTKQSDVEAMNGKFSEIVVLSKKLNVQDLAGGKSTIPLIGPLIDKFKLKRAAFMTKLDTVGGQIDDVLQEMNATSKTLQSRHGVLEDMFQVNIKRFTDLEKYIVAGKIRLELAHEELAQMKADAAAINADPIKMQEIADFETAITLNETHISSMVALQHEAVLMLPTIRSMQRNNQLLVAQFHVIRDTTIPLWREQFLVAIIGQESLKAAEFTNKVADITQDMIKNISDMNRQTTASVARSTQRQVIDLNTLEYQQKNLIASLEDVIKIDEEGRQNRKALEEGVKNMQTEIKNRFMVKK